MTSDYLIVGAPGNFAAGIIRGDNMACMVERKDAIRMVEVK
jgi:hypothetical protein